jgi:phosphoserine aminotransferase
MGIAGICFTIIRDDVIDIAKRNIEEKGPRQPVGVLLDWPKQASRKDYFINTASTFSIYMSGLVLK